MNIKQLNQHLTQLKIKARPHYPEYAIVPSKHTDKNANGLEKAIVAYLQSEGWQAERVKTMGRMITIKGPEDQLFNRNFDQQKYIPGSGTKGSSDISATIKGRSVKIEVKIGKDRQSEYQIKYQKDIEKAGGVYVIAKDFETWHSWYVSFISSI